MFPCLCSVVVVCVCVFVGGGGGGGEVLTWAGIRGPAGEKGSKADIQVSVSHGFGQREEAESVATEEIREVGV